MGKSITVYAGSPVRVLTRADVDLPDPSPAAVLTSEDTFDNDSVGGGNCDGARAPESLPRLVPQKKRMSGEIDPAKFSLADLQQRALGDCGLIAGIGAVLAREPNALREMFRVHDDGTVSVRFFVRQDSGKVVPVWKRIDSDFWTHDGKTLYAGTSAAHGSTLWVALIEKAYAQMEGDSYKSLDGIEAAEVVFALTGKAADTFDVGNERGFLIKALRAGKPVVLGSGAEVLGEAKPFCIEALHYYAAVGIHKDRHGSEFLMLTNPWGRNDILTKSGDVVEIGRFLAIPLMQVTDYFEIFATSARQ